MFSRGAYHMNAPYEAQAWRGRVPEEAPLWKERAQRVYTQMPCAGFPCIDNITPKVCLSLGQPPSPRVSTERAYYIMAQGGCQPALLG